MVEKIRTSGVGMGVRIDWERARGRFLQKGNGLDFKRDLGYAVYVLAKTHEMIHLGCLFH